jgi:endonuclease/exonuclease/phosphatase (EEP) superfamily protein YafD
MTKLHVRLWQLFLKMSFFGFVFVSLLTTLASLWWVFDLFTSFHTQYLIGGLILMSLFLLQKQWPWLIMTAIITLYHASLVVPLYVMPATTVSAQPNQSTYRIMYSNVHFGNRDYQALVAEIKRQDPDIIFFAELEESSFQALLPHLSQYPFHHLEKNQFEYFNMAVFSRIAPTELHKAHYFGGTHQTSLEVRVGGTSGEPELVVLGMHPTPPRSTRWATSRNLQLATAAEYVAELKEPVVMIGDLNATSWSSSFIKLIKTSGLRDTRVGLQPSWPRFLPLFMRFTIDHALVSHEVLLHERSLGGETGSDHEAVVVEVSAVETAPLTQTTP